MGQATADLPDPLAASASAPNSTDDLLAQLAGEEIERLLAETDTSPPEAQPPEHLAAAIAPPALVTTHAAIAAPTPIPAAVAPAHASAAVVIAPPPTAPATAAVVAPESPPTAAPAEDLESIFTQLDEREQAAVAATPKPALAKAHATPAAAEGPSVADALAAEMAEDAAQHARPAGGHSAAKALDTHAADVSDEGAADAKPSLLVTLLALMSSPLDSFSDQTRDLIGKAAILTMLNALCVLAYVIFFRR